MAKSFDYCNVSHSSHGLMKCALCGKKITEGDYRTREKPKAYVTWHRACCLEDPKWAQIEADRATHSERIRNMHADAIVFRGKWGVSDLDELIEELQGYVDAVAGPSVKQQGEGT
jgi:hypothetical protein